MNLLMILLRVVHIFSGVFWVGVAFFNIMFLQPSIRATGADGQKVMGHLSQKTRFASSTYAAATLTSLSGLIMYWLISGFDLAFIGTGRGMILTIGSGAGLIAWVVAIVVIRGILGSMSRIGRAIQTQGGPPSPEQASEMQALAARLAKVGNWGLILMTISMAGMASARYVVF